MDKITYLVYTPEQFRKKVMPLSTNSWAAFQMVQKGSISQRAASFARDADDAEWQDCDWLKALGGMPADAGPEQAQALGKFVLELVNDWLNEEI